MKNKILITIALWLLKKVNKDKIKYKNSWRYYIGEIELFLDDTKMPDGELKSRSWNGYLKWVDDKWFRFVFTSDNDHELKL